MPSRLAYPLSSIYAHRGLWSPRVAPNSAEAIQAAIEEGFSVEIDLLESASGVKVAHSVEDLSLGIDAGEVIGMGRFALNLKSDGAWKIDESGHAEIAKRRSFFFDGSNPTMRHVSQLGLPIANRVSEIEQPMSLSADYLWVDSFGGSVWWNLDTVNRWLSEYKRVIFVSAELHGFEVDSLWDFARKLIRDASTPGAICVCTDHPSEFARFVGV